MGERGAAIGRGAVILYVYSIGSVSLFFIRIYLRTRRSNLSC